MAGTEYPKAMYKGELESAEYKRVQNLDEEQALRDEGFVSGHEFFSPKPVVEAVAESTEPLSVIDSDVLLPDQTDTDNLDA